MGSLSLRSRLHDSHTDTVPRAYRKTVELSLEGTEASGLGSTAENHLSLCECANFSSYGGWILARSAVAANAGTAGADSAVSAMPAAESDHARTTANRCSNR